jgi:hypothetical protein
MPTCTPWASSQDLSWARYKLWQAVRYVHVAPVLLKGPAVNVFVASADICHRADAGQARSESDAGKQMYTACQFYLACCEHVWVTEHTSLHVLLGASLVLQSAWLVCTMQDKVTSHSPLFSTRTGAGKLAKRQMADTLQLLKDSAQQQPRPERFKLTVRISCIFMHTTSSVGLFLQDEDNYASALADQLCLHCGNFCLALIVAISLSPSFVLARSDYSHDKPGSCQCYVTDSMTGLGQTLAQTVSCVVNYLACSGGAGLP